MTQPRPKYEARIEHDPEPWPPGYPPCLMCGGPNDMGEVCSDCAPDNDPLPEETSGYECAKDLLDERGGGDQ